MTNRGRTLKVAAVLTLSALALTGFTTGRGHGGSSRHGGGGGGGGCSSSSQDHDSSSSSSSGSSGSASSGGSGYDDYDDNYDDDYDDGYGSSTSGGSSGGRSGGGAYNRRPNHDSTASSSPGGHGLRDAKAKLVKCASAAAPYATVKVTNSNARTSRFSVSVSFVDAAGVTVAERTEKVKVPGDGKATARLEIGDRSLVESVEHCEVDPQAMPVPD